MPGWFYFWYFFFFQNIQLTLQGMIPPQNWQSLRCPSTAFSDMLYVHAWGTKQMSYWWRNGDHGERCITLPGKGEFPCWEMAWHWATQVWLVNSILCWGTMGFMKSDIFRVVLQLHSDYNKVQKEMYVRKCSKQSLRVWGGGVLFWNVK